jgi:hypothetical protein
MGYNFNIDMPESYLNRSQGIHELFAWEVEECLVYLSESWPTSDWSGSYNRPLRTISTPPSIDINLDFSRVFRLIQIAIRGRQLATTVLKLYPQSRWMILRPYFPKSRMLSTDFEVPL